SASSRWPTLASGTPTDPPRLRLLRRAPCRTGWTACPALVRRPPPPDRSPTVPLPPPAGVRALTAHDPMVASPEPPEERDEPPADADHLPSARRVLPTLRPHPQQPLHPPGPGPRLPRRRRRTGRRSPRPRLRGDRRRPAVRPLRRRTDGPRARQPR